MKVVILTSSTRGTASHHLPVLVANGVDVVAVVLASSAGRKTLRFFIRKLKKILKIGLAGAWNGRRMRSWYDVPTEDLRTICQRLSIPVIEVPSIGDNSTADALQRLHADMGVSLGNGYIPKRIFSIPRLGMINIHHEILPEYQNAQSVIWQLYNGSVLSGYTIHKIERKIDAGGILFQEQVPIIFRETLGATVSSTYSALLDASALGLVQVLSDLPGHLKRAREQGAGSTYTTPTWRQFRQILRNHDRLRKAATAAAPRPASNPAG